MSSSFPADDQTGRTPLLQSDDASSIGPASISSSISDVSYRRKRVSRRAADLARTISFISAVLTALCAGSITVFSLYGHIFQERLRYTQFQVNGVAIGSSIALYLPVSLLGYICDRMGTAPLSALAAILFGGGYGLAAAIYRHLDIKNNRVVRPGAHGMLLEESTSDWSYPLMVVAFFSIGVATCAMYLSTVATCAKNFGRGKHRGLALATPIAAFGLSGMWLSQVGSRLFCERKHDGTCGDVDVFRFFIFLAVLLVVVGIIGIFTLRVVNEDELIDEAVEELERSGILDGSSLFTRRSNDRGYGTLSQADIGSEEDDAGILASSVTLEDDAKWKKNWVLNAETRRFLTDHTMWAFALGFLLAIGPGEAFINNLGTVIGTLYPPTRDYVGNPTSAATHVSIVGVTSTVARLLTGTLTDLLAPAPQTQHVQVASSTPLLQKRFSVSRVVFLIFFAGTLSLGLTALASGLIQNHGERFWIVSGLIGAGYGAVFSITPIIITVIWGVENFGTNWGIVAMFPALGSTFWGLVYSAVYQAGAQKSAPSPEGENDIFCYGRQCYASTFWAMAVTVWISIGMILWAWKGRNGWAQRGIVI
jgi:MFS family permease